MSAKESSVGHSLLRFSSVSSEDSLPLGCEHKEYYWIKRYRALKRSIHEEIPEARPVITEADAHKFKRLPCTRFYLDRDYQFLPEFRDMLRNALIPSHFLRRLAGQEEDGESKDNAMKLFSVFKSTTGLTQVRCY